MAFTEFYVSQEATAVDSNSGHSEGLAIARTNVDSNAAGTTLTDNDPGPWPTVNIGDWVCYNDGANYELAYISGIAGAVATITPALSAALQSKVGQTARVGGELALPSTAATRLDRIGASKWPAGIDIPRINIKRHAGIAYNESTDIAFATDWSGNLAMTVEGYNNTPGDIDCLISTDRAAIDFGANANGVNISADHVYLWNLDVTANSNNRCFEWSSGSYYCGAVNCAATSNYTAATWYGFYSKGRDVRMVRCVSNYTTTPAGSGIYQGGFMVGPQGLAYGCEAYGQGKTSKDGYGFNMDPGAEVIACIAHNVYYGAQIATYSVLDGCTIANCGIGVMGGESRWQQIAILNTIVAHCNYGWYNYNSNTPPVLAFNNLFQDIGVTVYRNVEPRGSNNIEVANPNAKLFRDHDNGDLRLWLSSRAARGGFPGMLASGTEQTTGQTDMGALGILRRKAEPHGCT